MDQATLVMEVAKLVVTSVITVVAASFGIAIQRGMKKIAERQAETARQAKEVAVQAKEVATAKLNEWKPSLASKKVLGK
jgi:archaellum component FlaG (FlaF/FlaG flagellin family)